MNLILRMLIADCITRLGTEYDVMTIQGRVSRFPQRVLMVLIKNCNGDKFKKKHFF